MRVENAESNLVSRLVQIAGGFLFGLGLPTSQEPAILSLIVVGSLIFGISLILKLRN